MNRPMRSAVLCGRAVLLAWAVLGVVPPTLAYAAEGSFFYCPKSDGFVAINAAAGLSLKQFPRSDPFNFVEGDVDGSAISAKLQHCNIEGFLCLREYATSSDGVTVDALYTYAVPRILRVGDVYQVEGATYRVFSAPSFVRGRAAVQIVGDSGGNSPVRFKMYVSQGSGVVGLFFGELSMPSAPARPLVRKVMNEYCQFLFGAPLFSTVRLVK